MGRLGVPTMEKLLDSEALSLSAGPSLAPIVKQLMEKLVPHLTL